ncbi:hypothetical protein ABK040_000036 [Willaertia magna]
MRTRDKIVVLYAIVTSIVTFLVLSTFSIIIGIVIKENSIPKKCDNTLFLKDNLFQPKTIFLMDRNFFNGDFIIEKINNNITNIDYLFNLTLKEMNGEELGILRLKAVGLPSSIDLMSYDKSTIHQSAKGSYLTLSTELDIQSCTNDGTWITTSYITQKVDKTIRSYILYDKHRNVKAVMRGRIDFILDEFLIIPYSTDTEGNLKIRFLEDNSFGDKLEANQVIARIKKNLDAESEQWFIQIGDVMDSSFDYRNLFYLIGYLTFREK